MSRLPIPGIDQFDVAHTKVTLCFSAVWASFSTLFNKYFFDDWDFLPFLVVLVTLDTATGVWKSLKRSDFSSYSFGAFITKVILYAIFLFVIHGLTSFSKSEAVKTMFVWIEQLGYAAIIVREAVSIIENIGVIAPKLIPNWILKRLRQFDDNGQFQGSDSSSTPPN